MLAGQLTRPGRAPAQHNGASYITATSSCSALSSRPGPACVPSAWVSARVSAQRAAPSAACRGKLTASPMSCNSSATIAFQSSGPSHAACGGGPALGSYASAAYPATKARFAAGSTAGGLRCKGFLAKSTILMSPSRLTAIVCSASSNNGAGGTAAAGQATADKAAGKPARSAHASKLFEVRWVACTIVTPSSLSKTTHSMHAWARPLHCLSISRTNGHLLYLPLP